jgi:anti-sigma B factor antagonist
MSANRMKRRGLLGKLARVDVQETDGLLIAVITGEIDLSNADEIGRALLATPSRPPGLIVDLHGTSYLDSTGLALLYDLALRLRQRTQDLVIVSPPGTAPRRVFEVTGLPAEMTIVDELDAALARMQQATH